MDFCRYKLLIDIRLGPFSLLPTSEVRLLLFVSCQCCQNTPLIVTCRHSHSFFFFWAETVISQLKHKTHFDDLCRTVQYICFVYFVGRRTFICVSLSVKLLSGREEDYRNSSSQAVRCLIRLVMNTVHECLWSSNQSFHFLLRRFLRLDFRPQVRCRGYRFSSRRTRPLVWRRRRRKRVLTVPKTSTGLFR